MHELNLLIAINKERLEDLAEQYGRTHPRVLRQNRKLDKLIVQWHKLQKMLVAA
ncbi:aspartyl-phosphate phosphatase Spo0E family protein [Desulfotomaculum sp. 1211_IL3151]|uniref:aspartyl-phosphate phosphatase Spo0E family protein n=1 Tax=Desulfotomaculum sp. 1211_IL3151 TaxID=3084055 RepID=UPI002FD88124